MVVAPPPTAVLSEASTLVIPVSVPLADLAAKLHETLPATLVDKTNEPPAPIDEAVAKANARLARIELPKGGSMSARLDEVEVRDVALREDVLLVRASVTGDAEVDLDGALASP
ncbi:MAG: hypothetical protein AAF211_12280 [Myxococcota bacterium]